jgi:hypothetical protein
LRPRYGYGLFSVDSAGEFRQKVIFFYWDPEEELYHAVATPESRMKELASLKENMQFFVDSERIVINGEEVKARVVHVDVGFVSNPRRPFIEFLILFKGRLVRGVNRYENYYETERVEYDYRVTWILPEGFKFLKADFGFPYEVFDDRVVVINVKKGSTTPGYEYMEFLAS